jgi:hypothetical protein
MLLIARPDSAADLTGPQEWKNNHFQRVSLQRLGLRFQVGHTCGAYCPAAQPGPSDFVVLALNGIHVVNIDFCGCHGAPNHFVQLLEICWWPSTPLLPQSAATMDVLRTFHVMNLQARVSPTDFYRSLERLSDGQGALRLPVSDSSQHPTVQLIH